MRRHIPIFALLLSAFAAVGPARAEESFTIYWASSTHKVTIVNCDDTDLIFDSYNTASEGYYHKFGGYDYGATDLQIYDYQQIEAKVPDGYEFNGWYTKEGDWSGHVEDAQLCIETDTRIDGATIINKAGKWNNRRTIVAKYEVIPLTVTFDTNEGTPSSIAKITGLDIESTGISLPSVSRGGYDFAGWKNEKGDLFEPQKSYTGADFWYAAAGPNSRGFYSDLTAQWTGKTYSITIDRDGGTGGNCPANYTVSETQQELTITPPTKEGHTIEKWTVTGALSGNPSVVISGDAHIMKIPANTYGPLTLKPVWTKIGYDLIIHHEGAYYDGKLMEKTTLEPLVSNATNFNEILVAVATNDATFSGYYDSPTGGKKIYDDQGKCCKVTGIWSAVPPDGTYQGHANLEVWAIWGPPPEHCTIRAVCDPADGGTVEPASTNAVKGKSATLTATPNTGYSFCCWTNETGTVVSTDDHYTFTVNADAIYTAVFTGNVVKVMFISAGWNPPFKNIDVQVGVEWKTFFPPVTAEGQRFVGWYSSDVYAESSRIDGEAKVPGVPPSPLYAKWEEVPPVVTFADPEGGHESIPEERTKGLQIGKPAEGTEKWERDGYWRDNSSDWDPPLTTVVSGNMTVIAKWTSIADVLDCPNLTFNVSAGPNWRVCTSEHVVGDSCMQLESNTGNDHLSVRIPEAGTLSFNWKVNAGTLCVSTNNNPRVCELKGPTSKWVPGEKETIEISGPCDLTFYGFSTARTECLVDNVSWTPGGKTKEHTVTFVDPSGTFPPDAVTVEEGTAACAPTWISDKFDPVACGWDKDFSKVMADMTVNAVWTCRVEFVDRETAMTNKVAYWESVDAPADLKPYPGYTHTGWNPELPEHVESNLVLTAIWTPNDEYTVTYRPGTGISGSTMTQSEKKGVAVRLHGKDRAYGRIGYSQDGWAVTDDGTKAFEFGATYDRNVSTNLYPCWTNNRYTVTFDPNGGSAAPAPKAVTFDEAYGDLPSPGERGGYEFIGWVLASGDAVTSETIVKTAKDHELVAQWKQDMGDVSAALDCNNLMFKATGGWTIREDPDFAYTKEGGNDFYLRTGSADSGESGLSTTITVPGQLTFYWRAQGDGWDTTDFSVFVNGDERPIASQEDSDSGWVKETITVAADAVPATIRFACDLVGLFCAIDYVTWTPEGGGEPTPGEPVKPTAAGVEDGVFSLTIPTAIGTDYGVWTNADLTIDSWGLMGDPKPGDGNPWKVEWTILPGFPQLFFRAHKVEFK